MNIRRAEPCEPRIGKTEFSSQWYGGTLMAKNKRKSVGLILGDTIKRFNVANIRRARFGATQSETIILKRILWRLNQK